MSCRLLILRAVLDGGARRLKINVTSLGQAGELVVDVRIADVSCVPRPVYIPPGAAKVVEAWRGHVEAARGTLLPGGLITSEGVRHPFIALVNGPFQ